MHLYLLHICIYVSIIKIAVLNVTFYMGPNDGFSKWHMMGTFLPIGSIPYTIFATNINKRAIEK